MFNVLVEGKNKKKKHKKHGDARSAPWMDEMSNRSYAISRLLDTFQRIP